METEVSWITPLACYLKIEQLPRDAKEVGKIKKKATKYVLLNNQLYKRVFSFSLLKILKPSESDYVIKEIHEGICGIHVGGRAMASKVIRAGYYWSTNKQDCVEFVRKCKKCQCFVDLHNAHPLEQLHFVYSS